MSDIGNIPGKAAEELEKIGRAVENVVRNNLPSEVAKCQGVAGCYEAVGQAVKNRLPEDVRKLLTKEVSFMTILWATMVLEGQSEMVSLAADGVFKTLESMLLVMVAAGTHCQRV